MAEHFYIALLHYPVYDRGGRVVASAVTNMDLHDIARSARTYGVAGFYVVTPLAEQRALVGKIRDHWLTGYGATHNPARKEAFESMKVSESLEEVLGEITARAGRRVRIVATGAGLQGRLIGHGALRDEVEGQGWPCLVVFGTGSGLADDVIRKADYLLEPLKGRTDYNHLSVRSAVAVTLDRLWGAR